MCQHVTPHQNQINQGFRNCSTGLRLMNIVTVKAPPPTMVIFSIDHESSQYLLWDGYATPLLRHWLDTKLHHNRIIPVIDKTSPPEALFK